MQNDPDFDAKLEEALASYADPASAGDRQALTARVLAAIETKRRRRWWFILAFASPAFACVLLVVFFAHHPPRPVGQTDPVYHPSLPAAPLIEAPNIKLVHLPARRVPKKRLPKLDQFPAPAPLTEQERLLVQFAAEAPLSTQEQIAKTQREAIAPLRIAELTIPKLDSNPQPK